MTKRIYVMLLALTMIPLGLVQAQTQTGTLQFTQQPTVEVVGDNSVTIHWATNQPAGRKVWFGTSANNMSQVRQEASDQDNTHDIQLTGLQPNTKYFYVVESHSQTGGGMIKSDTFSFQITPNNPNVNNTRVGAAPAQSGNASSGNTGTGKIVAGPIVQQTNDSSTTLWFLADSENPSNVQLRYGTDRNNLSQTANVTFAGREGTVNLTNLEPGKVYYFEIANAGTQTGEFETLAANYDRNQMRITHGPVIEYLDDDAAIIAWSTTRPSSTIVRYGTDPNNLNKQATAAWGSGTHRVRVGNLQPNTTYYFVVESSQAQGSGAVAKSDPAQFRTFERGAQAFKNPQPRIGK